MENQIMSFEKMKELAAAVAKSNLFGMKTPEQALALMALCEAEGMHPAIAIRDYHIIDGRPSLKADAMLARFQQSGGTIKWHDYTDVKVSATFSHPLAGVVTIDWDINKAKKAEVYKEKTSSGKTGMWVKYPRQMLKARVISEGIRATFPGVTVGMYTPEESQDFDDIPQNDRKGTVKVMLFDPPVETPMIEQPTVDAEIAPVESHELTTDEMKAAIIKAAGNKMDLVNQFLKSINWGNTLDDVSDTNISNIYTRQDMFFEKAGVK